MIAREIQVPEAEKAALARMLRDYVAELAPFSPGARADQPYPYFDLYWQEPETRWPFWLKAGDTNAGFALLRHDIGVGEMHMAEFFVARAHRGQGLGLAAARRLIARFPGTWKITQREGNAGAIAFWHKVFDGFVAYAEVKTHTDAVRREQRFRFP